MKHEEDALTIQLPVPTGHNALTANIPGVGRVNTKEYKAWIKAAGWTLQTQARGMEFPGRVGFALVLPESSKLDTDAALKATLDLLKRHHVIIDDSKKYVRKIVVTLQEDEPDMDAGDDMIVTVTAWAQRVSA